VLGSGPGGYTAAFRAADLGLKTVLVEKDPYLGGVCLNVGCIPSKALLHAAKVITEAEEMGGHGITLGKPKIDLDTLRDWKSGVVKKLTGGLAGLAKARKVQIVEGMGTFQGPNMITVEGKDGAKTVSFDQCVIAAGSEPVTLPFIPHDDKRVIDSTGALELDGIPKRLLVIGGGIIGLEMACVYDALGSKVTVVELMDQIIPGADKDIVKPLHKRIEGRYEAIHLGAKVTAVEPMKTGLKVSMEGKDGAFDDVFDKVLVAVGRRPNGKRIGADAAGVAVDERGFIAVDNQQRTNVSHIFAIGDVVGQPMLAHKAVHEGKVAAEVAAGHKRAFDARVIPSVAYTDPEVAWAGMTENEAKAQGVKYGKGEAPIQDRQQDQRQRGRGQQPADDDDGQRALDLGAGAGGEQQRHQAEGGDVGGHQHRAQPALGALDDDLLHGPAERRSWLNQVTMTTPFSTAMPSSAMKPTEAGTDRYSPVMARPTMPPISAKGMLDSTSAPDCTEPKVENSTRKISPSATGTTSARRAAARCWFSNSPPHSSQ
jgi:dihydrolipoamide dehydrogenase